MSATLLVIEDEPAIQELLHISLTAAGYQVMLASDAQQAYRLLRTQRPDLIVLDWMLPMTSGIALADELRRRADTHDIPIIMLTARGTEQDKIEGLEAGADDYVTKPFSPRELAARIRAVLRRRIPERNEGPVHAGGLVLDPQAHTVTGASGVLSLGPTEFRLLNFFMNNPNRVYTRAQLLDNVWGVDHPVEERTVDVHIRRLRKALQTETADYGALIQTVRGTGYRFSTTGALV